jgi:hypothetical protein
MLMSPEKLRPWWSFLMPSQPAADFSGNATDHANETDNQTAHLKHWDALADAHRPQDDTAGSCL